MIIEELQELRAQIHAMIPPDRREPGFSKKGPSAAMEKRATLLLDFLKHDAVGLKAAKPSPYIARQIGLYKDRDRKDRGVSIRGLGLLLLRDGFPMCAVTSGPANTRGIFLAETQEEIDDTSIYMLRMSLGTLDSALAIGRCRPFVRPQLTLF